MMIERLKAEDARMATKAAYTTAENVYKNIATSAKIGASFTTFQGISKETRDMLIEDGYSISYERLPYAPSKEWVIRW